MRKIFFKCQTCGHEIGLNLSEPEVTALDSGAYFEMSCWNGHPMKISQETKSEKKLDFRAA